MINIYITESAEMTEQFSNIQLKSSLSSAELPTSNDTKKPNNCGASQWNPFEDPTPFNQMTEDHIYEAEFDALRDRPNGNMLFDVYAIELTQNLMSVEKTFIDSNSTIFST